MFHLRLGLCGVLAILLVSETHSGGNERAEVERLAKVVQGAVVNKDIDKLMQYVHPSGTVFIDAAYTKAEISSLMKDKDSWLYKHLFVGEKSVRTYLLQAKNLKTSVHPQSDTAMFVFFESSNYEKWQESCFIQIDGKWYFDGIFSCE